MIELPNVTVIIADTKNYGRAAYAIAKTLEQVKPARTIWLTDIDYDHPDVEVIKVSPIKSKAEYSYLMIKKLSHYFTTSHCLVIQHDGYVIDSSMWTDDYLDYDYIGAPWLYPDPDRNVGNGGFSLRSHKLQTYIEYDKKIEIVEPEDEVIGRLYRRYLEATYDLSFAPEELAHKFSYELHEPYSKTFGFHGYFHPPFKPIVVINRTGAMGDVIGVEPVLHEYHNNGYRVVLKTLPQFYSLFSVHYFPVENFDTLNQALPYKYIDLDMAYEAKPKQLHLKSYYEIAGVEGALRNPRLNYVVTRENVLFPRKYVVLHIDDRPDTPHRNIRGINWSTIISYLESKGYLCFQIGKNESAYTSAIRMNTLAEPMLAYLISGCDLFLGIDSGPSHIAVATGRKCVLFYGSVNPDYIHADLKDISIVTNHYKESPCCGLSYCWHESITTIGQDCIEDKYNPPCCLFTDQQIIDAINKSINE